jgi:hypothetical protein
VAELIGSLDDPIAIVIRSSDKVEGIAFFSAAQSPQQIGQMSRPAGYQVNPHRHNKISREISQTQEVLLIRSGKCVITLFNDDNSVLQTIELETGDVIQLCKGGHSLRVIENCDIIEIKQGPYLGAEDKTLFEIVD